MTRRPIGVQKTLSKVTEGGRMTQGGPRTRNKPKQLKNVQLTFDKKKKKNNG